AHRALARVLVGVSPEQVVQQALAHRAVRYLHAPDAELVEHLREDGDAPGKGMPAVVVECLQVEVADVPDTAQFAQQRLELLRADFRCVRIHFPDALEYRANRARAADRLVPSPMAKRRAIGLDLLARG